MKTRVAAHRKNPAATNITKLYVEFAKDPEFWPDLSGRESTRVLRFFSKIEEIARVYGDRFLRKDAALTLEMTRRNIDRLMLITRAVGIELRIDQVSTEWWTVWDSQRVLAFAEEIFKTYGANLPRLRDEIPSRAEIRRRARLCLGSHD